MNLTDYHVTPPHLVFDEIGKQSTERGLRVTGSELVGLIPLEALLNAGRYYLEKQGASAGVPDADLITVAVQSMGLDEFAPFEPKKKVIEYAFEDAAGSLVEMSARGFTDELSRDSAAPGGGSVAALCGALGAGLAAMVANLTHGKKGYKGVWDAMGVLACEGQALKDRLLRAVDDDTAAFNEVMAAFGLPKKSDEEKAARAAAIEAANQKATLVPLSVVEAAGEVLALAGQALEKGNQNSLSDAGVAALMGRAAADGAYYNVLINLQGLGDEAFVAETRRRADEARSAAVKASDELQAATLAKLG